MRYAGIILSFDPGVGQGLIEHLGAPQVWPFLGADCGVPPAPGTAVTYDLGLRPFGAIQTLAAVSIL
jgi:hypothetical protein